MKNKSAIVRYHVINQCLAGRGKKYWSTQELIERFEDKDIFITLRTLRYDIDAMRHDERLNYKAPIAYCSHNKGYYYTEAGYTIETMSLNSKQRDALEFVIGYLEGKHHVVDMQEFLGAVDTITYMPPPADIVGKQPDAAEIREASFYPSSPWMNTIQDTIDNNKALAITYASEGRSGHTTHLVHPCMFTNCRDRWHLVAMHYSQMKTVLMALDRIHDIKVASHNTAPPIAKHANSSRTLRPSKALRKHRRQTIRHRRALASRRTLRRLKIV